MSKNIPELYGSLIFSDKIMKEKLPRDVYKALRHTIETGSKLELGIANSVAVAMKEWAIENGATHYTHWFQPLTGITAEKHDSFINPVGEAEIIMDFSGKELVKGEPDASSFPSGGLRSTFEARGYTAWDPTSPAFLKDGSLYIPTSFCSYSGEALDTKTPLLCSMEVINKAAVRILHILGDTDVTRVISNVGAEQEYFLIDKKLYDQRPDLKFTGRTLLGALPPKGQEMDDHYFGTIRPRVSAFMKEVDEELWKLGIPSKTKHNEVAPSQHELAPIYSTTNVAVDNNQLVMETLKRVAEKHGLVCLLHEKPFEGINGSGKHNNYSLTTNTGINLFSPGKEPAKNIRFLTFFLAILKAVDVYGDLLRASVATASNDKRLGGNEAPPAIISAFIGADLEEAINIIENDLESHETAQVRLKPGAKVLARFDKDATDRNRTSPFAFTGNKFEFRMPGSSVNVAECNVVLNTALADVLNEFSDRLEKFAPEEVETELYKIFKEVIRDHAKIIFNGNGYTEEWVEEANRRGLYNLPTCAEAFDAYKNPKNIALFERNRVYTEIEVLSRHEIMLENYNKTVNIEARTLLHMMNKFFLPAVSKETCVLTDAINSKKTAIPGIICPEERILNKLNHYFIEMLDKAEDLSKNTKYARTLPEEEKIIFYAYTLRPMMNELRAIADKAEKLIPDESMPYPTYDKLLFSV